MDDRAGDGFPCAVPVAQTSTAKSGDEAEDQLGSGGGESQHQAGSCGDTTCVVLGCSN